MTPADFAASLFAVAVALGAAIVISGDRSWGLPGRVSGALGFVTLAAGEAVTGSGLFGDLAPTAVALRTAGYALLLLGALPSPARPAELPAAATSAVVVLPVALPAGAAGAAALAVAWRRRRAPGVVPLAAGLLLLSASEAALEAAPGSALALRVVGYLGVALFVLRAVRSSIRLRFASAMVGLLVVVGLVASVVVASVLGQNVREAALDQVVREADAAAGELLPLVTNETGKLVVVADQALPRFRKGEGFTQAEMTSLLNNLFPGVRFILFLSARGQVLGRVGLSPADATELLSVDVVRSSLRTGRETASLDTVGERRLVLVGAAPVLDRDRVVGVAVAGYVLDGTLLDSVTGSGNLSAVFRESDPVPVATNERFQPPARKPVVDGATLQSLWEDFLSGAGTIRRSLDVSGVETFAALTPLVRSDGEAVGILMVAQPAEAVAASQRLINRLLFAATVLLFGLAFVLAAMVARRITGPVISLTEAAGRVATGDLGTKAPIGGEDEVGDLAAAFNQMTESLALSHVQLSQAAEEEARLRGRLETVVNSMGDGLIAVDDGGRVVTYNPAAAAILGRSRGNVLGRPLGQVVEIRDSEGRPVSLGEELRRGTAFVQREDGRLVPVAIVSSPLRDVQRRSFGQVLVLRDMTREHEVERMKTEFLASVSHELRTPLTPIIGYSEILSGREVPAERVRQFADAMLASAHRLERIVAMLLDFAAMESGRMKIEAEPTALHPVISRAVEDWRGRAEQHRFVTNFDPSLPEALIDVTLMRRAIDEVLDNAVKYSPQGGTVTVSVSSENSRRRRMLRLDVRDEGIGIEPEDLPRIFEDFRQLDASDTRSFGGLGLGLAFVRRIMEAHRGTIDARSVPGEGTTFTLLIPVAETEGGRVPSV